MRSYGNYLLLSGLLENVPATNTTLYRFADYVLRPSVRVVAADCFTHLGSVEAVGSSLVGKTELSTGLTIDEARVNELQEEGVYKASVRTLSTCTADKGVCQSCFAASYPDEPLPDVDTIVKIVPADTSPFFSYVASGYSGSLIGVRALPAGRLPIRKALMDQALAQSYLDMAYGQLKKFSQIPSDMLQYCGGIEDKLEKALFIIVLYSLFSSIRS